MLALLEHCGPAYERRDGAGRRDYNHAFFSSIEVGAERDGPVVSKVTRHEVIEAVRQADTTLGEAIGQEQQRRRGAGHGGVESVASSNLHFWWS